MQNNLFRPSNLINNQVVHEIYTHEKKTKEFLFPIENCDVFFETLQGSLRDLINTEELDVSYVFDDLPECKTVLKKGNVLGEYFPGKQKIKYYDQTPETLQITEIHERFHAVHHLTKDRNGVIWENFTDTPSFDLELLAQLFTYIYIRNYNSSLLRDFEKLNDGQPLIYQTYKIFKHYNTQQAEDLYWIIRNQDPANNIYRVLKQLEEILNKTQDTIKNAVFNGIRKTINRFREHPFLYFTESDIHASLSKDIMEGNSDLFIIGKDIKNRSKVNVPVSLIHHEYPTNFRYQNSKLKDSGYNDEEIHLTNINGIHGDRGNYDLVILNEYFIEDLFSQHQGDLMGAMKHIINKDKKLTINRITKEEVLIAIEVKFIHPFNAGNIQMETEVKKDNNKLHIALRSSGNFIMPINLVFCSSNYVQSNKNSVIDNIKKYLQNETHKGVCSIFIESYFSQNKKKTPKPIIIFDPISADNDWAIYLKTIL